MRNVWILVRAGSPRQQQYSDQLRDDLQGSFQTGKTLFWQPYLKVNLWHGFEGDDEVAFGGSDNISSEHRTTAIEAGGGIVIKVHEVVGLYATLSWTNDVDGNTVHSLGGNFGVRVAW